MASFGWNRQRWSVTIMKTFWNFIFRGSGLCLGVCAVVFMSVPSASTWKKTAGIACAIFGTVLMIAMYFARKTEHAEEIHLVKRELEHYPPDIDQHFD